MFIKILLCTIALIASLTSFAQQATSDVEMADTMRGNGKIYVVVAVLLIIFAGIIAYLISIDRKIGKLEREEKNEIKN